MSRKLAKKSVGPKRRKYNVPTKFQANMGEWYQFLQTPASDGGIGGTIMTYTDTAGCAPTEELTNSEKEKAANELNETIKMIEQAEPWASTPVWSVTREIWLMILRPTKAYFTTTWVQARNKKAEKTMYVPPQKTKKGKLFDQLRDLRKKAWDDQWQPIAPRPDGLGLGADKVSSDNMNILGNLTEMIATMRAVKTPPPRWQRSYPYMIPKTTAKLGCAALRLVHGLDTFGKAYYKQLWRRRLNPATAPDWSFAYQAGRRRES